MCIKRFQCWKYFILLQYPNQKVNRRHTRASLSFLEQLDLTLQIDSYYLCCILVVIMYVRLGAVSQLCCVSFCLFLRVGGGRCPVK